MIGGFQVGAFQPFPAYQQQRVTQDFSGGFLYAYERQMQARARKRRDREEHEEQAKQLKDTIDREIAALLHAQESERERQEELDRLQELIRVHSSERLELSDRAKLAYARALTKATFSALEALDRELQRQLEEEEAAALIILLH